MSEIEQMPYCPECGAKSVPGDAYCPFCGFALNTPLVFQNSTTENTPDKNDLTLIDSEGFRPFEGIAPENSPLSPEKIAEDNSAIGEEVAEKSSEEDKRVSEDAPIISEPIVLREETAAEVAESHQTTNHISEEVASDDFEATLVQPWEERPDFRVKDELPKVENVLTDDKNSVTGKEISDLKADAPESVDRAESDGEVKRYTQENLKISGTAGANAGKSATLKPLKDGTVLGKRYRIVRRIGGGGMGAVYMAEDENLGNANRAVKEMIQAYVDDAQQQKAIADFKRESMMLSTLEHPSIPTIYDYFFDDENQRFYLVMKYISGGDLAARLRSTPDGRLEERFVCETAAQIADVLDYLHNQEKPIIYRDLKPSNVMIDGTSGRAMLVDFGIARSVNKEEKGVTAVGTMGYAPPELFSGNAEPRTDIYSLGATMFHLLTGADPQNNPLLIFDFSKNPRPRQLNPSLSNEMEKILLRAVEYNPEARFASAAEMRNVLLEHLERLRLGKESYGDSSRQPTAAPLNAVPMVFCGFCGEKIAANVVYCVYCGSRQPEAERFISRQNQSAPMPNQPTGNITPMFTAARLTGRLTLVGTAELNPPTFNLDKPNILIGRRDPHSNIFPEVDLTRFDPTTKVSRRHARIWRENEGFLVEDLGSSNGTTILDGNTGQTFKLVPNQPHMLAEGDRLRVGETTLQFSLSR